MDVVLRGVVVGCRRVRQGGEGGFGWVAVGRSRVLAARERLVPIRRGKGQQGRARKRNAKRARTVAGFRRRSKEEKGRVRRKGES